MYARKKTRKNIYKIMKKEKLFSKKYERSEQAYKKMEI